MKCPVCSQEYNCPCDNCMKNFPDRLPKFIKTYTPVYMESCPNCGMSQTIDAWFNEEGRQQDEYKKTQEGLSETK